MVGSSNMGTLGQYGYRAKETVGTTSINVLPSSRWSVIVFRNSSAGGQVITLDLGQIAVSLTGITLSPGQAYVESNSEGFVTFDGTVQAISDGAGGILSIYAR